MDGERVESEGPGRGAQRDGLMRSVREGGGQDVDPAPLVGSRPVFRLRPPGGRSGGSCRNTWGQRGTARALMTCSDVSMQVSGGPARLCRRRRSLRSTTGPAATLWRAQSASWRGKASCDATSPANGPTMSAAQTIPCGTGRGPAGVAPRLSKHRRCVTLRVDDLRPVGLRILLLLGRDACGGGGPRNCGEG